MTQDKKRAFFASLDATHAERALVETYQDSQTGINDELVRELRLKNNDAEQNIALKKMVLRILFWFLGIETCLIFLYALFQAVAWPFGFHLEEWSFNILITATILQIASMLLVAVRYLFPSKEETK